MRSVGEAELAWGGEALARLEASPSPWRDSLLRGILVETSPGSGASPGLESLVLSEIFADDVMGPGRPARGTLVSTVPTFTT